MNQRAFISYSWTSDAHERWVVELATELRESGVDVVLDKWDLKEGQDKHHFMERMVTDPDVAKVIVVCDKEYSRKADERSGGVGTESQIISQEVYDKVEQRKFVAVLSELDEGGKGYLPTFFRSRIFIDLSDSSKRVDNFEQLVRWIYDQPLHKKPALGAAPEYITSPGSVNLGTRSRARRAVDAVMLGRDTAPGAIKDYLDAFAASLKRLRMDQGTESIADAAERHLGGLLPNRDEFVDLALVVSRYRTDEPTYGAFSEFFEDVLPLVKSYSRVVEVQVDTLRLFVYELVLYFVATLLRHSRLNALRSLFAREFLVTRISRSEGGLQPFVSLQQTPLSVVERARQRNWRLWRAIAEIMKLRALREDISIAELAQADFLIFVYSTVNPSGRFHEWSPWVTALAPEYQPFPVFERATSKRFLVELLGFFGVADREEFFRRLIGGHDAAWYQFWDQIELETLTNKDRLGAIP